VVGGQPGDHARRGVHRRHPGSPGQRGPGDRSAAGTEIEQPGPGDGLHHPHNLPAQLREEGQHRVVDTGNLVKHLHVRGHGHTA